MSDASFIESPFPPEITFQCLSSDTSSQITLLPEEEAVLSTQATAKRREQFTLGRVAARLALKELGFNPPPPILKGNNREPLWPKDVVGSITHTDKYAIAVATFSKDIVGLGIDLERFGSKQSQRLAERICLPSELTWLCEDESLMQERFALLFSAKETLFKALYPIYGRYFWFNDAELTWDPDQNCFIGTLQFSADTSYQKGTKICIYCLTKTNYVFTYTTLAKVKL
ncbi:4'-phosphopantetheinyl transferase superfamily protein [Oligoflexia bacterium]|nr:4'-phosphopantetheinyl transferase superfamily protein [Oligoflexia bacterium]